MPVDAFLLALAAAFLRALWNVLLAKENDVPAATAVAMVASVVAFAPVAVARWDVDARVWPYVAVTAVLQLVYFALVAVAYGRAELSFVYPIARGVAPVLVLVAGAAVVGAGASAGQALGVVLVGVGVILAILAMQNGEVDFVLNSLGLQRGLAEKVKSDPNLTVIENPQNGFRYISFNTRRRPMNDCAFRQAVAVLIDKEFVTTTILQGVAFPVYGFVPQANAAWYNSDIITLGKAMSREERTNLAREILKQAGYTWEGGAEPTWDPENRQVTQAGRLLMPDGTAVPSLVMPAPSPGYDPLRSTFAIWIETWLNEFGIPLTAQLAGFNVIVPIIFTEQNFDMYILGWSLSIFPSYLYDFFAEEQAVLDGNNAGGYVNPEVEARLKEILVGETFDGIPAVHPRHLHRGPKRNIYTWTCGVENHHNIVSFPDIISRGTTCIIAYDRANLDFRRKIDLTNETGGNGKSGSSSSVLETKRRCLGNIARHTHTSSAAHR